MIGFRVDANEQIATGHLMRCLSIAWMCRKRGEECLFFLAEDQETERLRAGGFSYHILHTDWKRMEDEVAVMKDLLRRYPLDYLVVDSYQATVKYLQAMQEILPVLYIDDMGQEIYPVSAVLHYGIGSDTEDYQKKYEARHTKVLAGMQYIPLREEFHRGSAWKEKESERKNSILITTGGTDPFFITGKLLEACLNYEGGDGAFFHECEYEVIVGALNTHRKELEQIAQRESRVKLHYNVSNMSAYMRSGKMAVSAGGTTLYELCACKIPAVCFSFADNQEPGTILFGRMGIMDYAGDARRTDVVEHCIPALIRLEQDREHYLDRQRRMEEAVDGEGALRIAGFLTGGN